MGRAADCNSASASDPSSTRLRAIVDIFRHQGEGLFFAEFSGAHRTDRTSVLRVASEMVAAETFHRDDLARAKILRCFLNRCHIAARNLIASLIKVMRAARGARDGLRVKAPIRGICVFGGAVSVERPRGHRGVRAIVGQGADDAVARAAIRAVNVRVVVAEIVRIEEFPQALFAYRQVRRNSRRWAGARPRFRES